MKKKIIALLLSTLIILTFGSSLAFAQSPEEVATAEPRLTGTVKTTLSPSTFKKIANDTPLLNVTTTVINSSGNPEPITIRFVYSTGTVMNAYTLVPGASCSQSIPAGTQYYIDAKSSSSQYLSHQFSIGITDGWAR